MNPKLVEDIANAVLYEGYMLYPYRASAIKNRQRWNFGVLYPRAFSETQNGNDPWLMQTECLTQSTDASAALSIRVRFLQLMDGSSEFQQSWQEASEREVSISSLRLSELEFSPVQQKFSFPANCAGNVEAQAEHLGKGLFKLRIRVINAASFDSSGSRESALMKSLVSAHTILELKGGEFVSLLDPPEALRDVAAECKNIGNWPVLVGEPGQRDTMLCSPIILYDYPQIAPESAGSLFDGTEIDEILTLRIMTLTDEEKMEMSQGDKRARQILQRTESMPAEQLMKMHGAVRGLRRTEQELP